MCAAESMGVAVHGFGGGGEEEEENILVQNRRAVQAGSTNRLHRGNCMRDQCWSEVFSVLELSDGATGHSLP
jgi:hypothetical protein